MGRGGRGSWDEPEGGLAVRAPSDHRPDEG